MTKLKLTTMAHGGMALGRDQKNRIIFVVGGIPGEMVDVSIEEGKKLRYGRLQKVLKPSSDRIKPVTDGLGPHGGYSYQHMNYKAQLRYKREVVEDQLKRIGGLRKAKIHPVAPSPQPWAYEMDVTLSPTADGRFGFWSPLDGAVMPVRKGNAYKTLVPALQNLLDDFDWELPDLRKLTLRAGSDGELLIAMEVQDVEPPSLHVDFPVSVTIVLPDRSTANLIGVNYVLREFNGRWFQISAGYTFFSNLASAEKLLRTVLKYAQLSKEDVVLELYSGVGAITAFLAEKAGEVHGIEPYPTAVEDATVNLDNTENVTLYEGFPEDVLPLLDIEADVWVMSPPATGLPSFVFDDIVRLEPTRLVYIGKDMATMARDGKDLSRIGYKLREVQPHDLLPQTFHVHTVSLWVLG